MAATVPGLDYDRMARDAEGGIAAQAVRDGRLAFDRAGLQGTPSFQLGRTGGSLKTLEVNQLKLEELVGPIEALRSK